MNLTEHICISIFIPIRMHFGSSSPFCPAFCALVRITKGLWGEVKPEDVLQVPRGEPNAPQLPMGNSVHRTRLELVLSDHTTTSKTLGPWMSGSWHRASPSTNLFSWATLLANADVAMMSYGMAQNSINLIIPTFNFKGKQEMKSHLSPPAKCPLWPCTLRSVNLKKSQPVHGRSLCRAHPPRWPQPKRRKERVSIKTRKVTLK